VDETEVIAEVLGGHKDAYSSLVERYHPGLYIHMYALVKDEDTAHDLTQTAFIKAYDSLHRYNPSYRFSTWLYRIGTNDALKHLKRHQRIGLDDIPELPDTYDPHEALRIESREARVRRAVAKLPLKYQTIISLYYWHNTPYAEIANILGIPIGTVRTWLSRAKQQLEKILGTYE
jgi:RNA polymerase sigma-70 factor, ECF subfamily